MPYLNLFSGWQRHWQNTKEWQKVKVVYHATENTRLSHAEKSEIVVFKDSNDDRICWPCSLFSCNLWNGSLPTISPYASKRVVMSTVDVLGSLDDYLLPICRYDDPTADPDKAFRNGNGLTYVELVYFRHQDVQDIQPTLTDRERIYLDAWKLRNHPFVRFDGQILSYRVIPDVWWIILTPYDVPISTGMEWKSGIPVVTNTELPATRIRENSNEVTLKMARNLPLN